MIKYRDSLAILMLVESPSLHSDYHQLTDRFEQRLNCDRIDVLDVLMMFRNGHEEQKSEEEGKTNKERQMNEEWHHQRLCIDAFSA